jgi:ABC-type multidrug transport system fused ATPase/permease subunit
MLESNMNRVERILHYTNNTAPEAPLVLAKGQRWDARHKRLIAGDADDDHRHFFDSREDLEEGHHLHEADTHDDTSEAAWPTEGRIEFRTAWMRYRHDLTPVLKGINLTIEARHKGMYYVALVWQALPTRM